MKRLSVFFLAVFYTVSALSANGSSRSVQNVSNKPSRESVENVRNTDNAKRSTSSRTKTNSTQVRENKNVVSRSTTNTNSREKEREKVKANVVSRTAVNQKKVEAHNRETKSNVSSRAARINTVKNVNTRKRNTENQDVRDVQNRALFSFGSSKQKTVTAESLAEAKDILEKTADLNSTCQQQYNECMDQFCAVVDANQKRCSCSANLAKYAKVQEAVENANAELNEVAQRIRYVGLSADEIRAIMNATEAEQAMSKNKDTTQTRSMLEEIEEMIKDPTAATSLTSSSSGNSLMDMDFDFSGDSSDMFSLDIFNSSKDISSKRGKDLYNEATKRCKTVLKQCKDAGGTENQITGNYDLAIDKDCIAYEQGLDKLNETLKTNVRSANLMLQKARLSVLQNKNQYDIKGCVGALEKCMLDDMVCGEDYVKCLDPTKRYIDENGNVVLGQNIANISAFLEYYNNTNITKDFIKNSSSDTTCPNGDGACIVNYLMKKIGVGATTKDGGLCRAVLDKCQDYTYANNGKNSVYEPYNDVVVNYVQRAMVNIKAAQARIISNYASTCLNDIATCYNQQVTQINSWTSSASADSIYNVLTGACYNVALTCGYAVFAYDQSMGGIINNLADEKEKRLTLIQGVSDMFYQSLLCPDNSSYTNMDKNSSGISSRYVNERCVCNTGYKVLSSACVACDASESCETPDNVFFWNQTLSNTNNNGSGGGSSNAPAKPDVTYNVEYRNTADNSNSISRTCSSNSACSAIGASDAAAAGITKQGHSLIGWSTRPNSTTVEYDFGTSVPQTVTRLFPVYKNTPQGDYIKKGNNWVTKQSCSNSGWHVFDGSCIETCPSNQNQNTVEYTNSQGYLSCKCADGWTDPWGVATGQKCTVQCQGTIIGGECYQNAPMCTGWVSETNNNPETNHETSPSDADSCWISGSKGKWLAVYDGNTALGGSSFCSNSATEKTGNGGGAYCFCSLSGQSGWARNVEISTVADCTQYCAESCASIIGSRTTTGGTFDNFLRKIYGEPLVCGANASAGSGSIDTRTSENGWVDFDCKCNSGYKVNGESCVQNCPYYTYGNKCVNSCGNKKIEDNNCVDECSASRIERNGICTLPEVTVTIKGGSYRLYQEGMFCMRDLTGEKFGDMAGGECDVLAADSPSFVNGEWAALISAQEFIGYSSCNASSSSHTGSGQYCWCKVTEKSGWFPTPDHEWVPNGSYANATTCQTQCTNSCYINFITNKDDFVYSFYD